MSGYELSRIWFNFCFENPEKVKPNHSAIYFFAIEHCNRLGWKDKFGFPSQMVMEAVGIKNWRTYSRTLIELVDFGFITMVETSKNQYSSNIIALVKNTKAPTEALDKALQKHSTKQGQSIVSIDKQYNKETIELLNNNISLVKENLKIWIDRQILDDEKPKEEIKDDLFEIFWEIYPNKIAKAKCKKEFAKLSEVEKEKISETINDFVKYKPFATYIYPNPLTYLNGKRWEDVIPKVSNTSNQIGVKKDFGKTNQLQSLNGFVSKTQQSY